MHTVRTKGLEFSGHKLFNESISGVKNNDDTISTVTTVPFKLVQLEMWQNAGKRGPEKS